MSAASTRMPAADARAIASRFVELIEPFCETVVVAGSIRRGATLVGDIEVCAIPRIQPVADLFGESVGTLDMLATELDTMLAAGVVEKRATNGMTAWGPKHKRIVFEGAPVDLFCAERERFGLILTIRTGPASYSHQLVTPRGVQTATGLPGRLPPHLRVAGGWLTYRVSGQKIETPTEQDFYREIGLPWREPSQRR